MLGATMQAVAASAAAAPRAARQLDVHGLFATPLVQGRLENAIAVNAELRRTILAHERTTPGRRVSIAGGWQSDLDFPRWAGPVGEHLLGTLLDLAKADKQPALGIADTNNLFGALEFSEKAAGKGIQPLLGAGFDWFGGVPCSLGKRNA